MSFKSEFYLSGEVTYLNAAYASPLPLRSAKAGRKAIDDRTQRFWETTSKDFFEGTEQLRAEVATLWNTRAENVAIVPSVSYGVETAVKNFSLTEGDEILVPQDDFPSNIYPWMEVAKKTGARIVTVPRPADFNWAKAFIEKISPHTTVVSVPLCDWSDGTTFDLAAIRNASRSVGAFFVVDVSQSFGAVPFSIPEIDPDFLFSVGYKWQLGPYGLAYMYVANRWMNGTPLENTWLGRAGSDDFSRLVEYKDAYQPGARRFDMGERSQFNLTPMALESMRLLKELSIAAIHDHVSALNRELYEGLLALRFTMPLSHRLAGHMIGARHPDLTDMSNLAARLKEKHLYVSPRGSSLRISPHLYNDAKDIERFLSVLEGELRGWTRETGTGL